MTLEEALRGLRAGDRQAAARALDEALQRMARARLIEPSTGTVVNIPDQERAEIVQRVTLKLLERGPLPVEGKGDDPCAAYLRTMLARAYLTTLRVEARRARVLAGGIEEAPPPAELRQSGPAAEHLLRQARALLEEAYEAARLARAPRYRPALELAWGQVTALVFGDATVEALLERDEGVGPAAAIEDIRRARWRLYTNHKRLRQGMREAIDALHDSGALDADGAEAARTALQLLFRCQTSGPPASP